MDMYSKQQICRAACILVLFSIAMVIPLSHYDYPQRHSISSPSKLQSIFVLPRSSSPNSVVHCRPGKLCENYMSAKNFVADCRTGKPCDNYTDVVDFRIIVLTFNRHASLLKLLQSLDDLELDGDRAVIEIWIDVDVQGVANEETLKAAEHFNWKKGPKRVHVQSSHAGIMGQWIDTWRPRPDSTEIGLLLEDDISVSPMAYRWLKVVHKGMANRTDFVGATLTSDQMSILSSRPRGPLAGPKNDTILMYKGFGTWGFSPNLEHWRRFQDWFHRHKPSVAPRFHPYVPQAKPTEQYKMTEIQGTSQDMWEMWFIYYMHIEQVFCVYSNLGVYTGNKESCLCINRREVGLHNFKKGPENLCKLLTVWRDEFGVLPTDTVRLHWDGSGLAKRDYHLHV